MRNAIDLSRAVLREPDVSDARHYRRRVLWLSLIYPGLFLGSLTGLVLLDWRGRFQAEVEAQYPPK